MKKVSFGARPPAVTPAASPEDWVADRENTPEPIKRLTIDIPLGLHRRVKTGCVREDVAIADVVREFLDRRFPADPQTQKHDDTAARKGRSQ
jgi:hypothetical protein